MAIHIGKLIEKRILEIGMSKSELGRRILVTPQNTHYILKKKSIDTNLLRKISLVLNYDFFQHYLGLVPMGKPNEALLSVNSGDLRAKLVEVKKEISTLELHNSYLREIVTLIAPAEKSQLIELRKLKKIKNL